MDIEIPDPIKDQCECLGGIDGLKKLLLSKKEVTKKSKILGAIQNPTRMLILDILVKQPLCVCIIKELVKMPDSKLSYHLNILKETGLIQGKRQGSWIIYYPTEEGLAASELINVKRR